MTRNRDTTDRTVRAQTTETEHDTAVLEGGTNGTGTGPGASDTTVRVKVPDGASEAEADAIVTAVREHLVATGQLSDGAERAATRRWIDAHRLQGVEPDARALLDNTDADPWVAASRASQRW